MSHKFVSSHHAVAGLLTAPQAALETCGRRLRRGRETHAEQTAFVLPLMNLRDTVLADQRRIAILYFSATLSAFFISGQTCGRIPL